MKRLNPMKPSAFLISAGLLAATLGGAACTAPCGPCAPRNRTTRAANPCAARIPLATNPCAARNPCAAKNPCAARNPCAAKNPCAARNPCAAKGW